MTFRKERGACLSSTVRKKSLYWFAFSTYENSETLERSSLSYGRSMSAMFPTVLYKVEGLETICICICIIREINSLLSKNYLGSQRACVMDNLIS